MVQSGSGLIVWRELAKKYEPRNEYQRRGREREVEGATMRPGSDPDAFITRVLLLSEKIKDIGGSVTTAKQTDIILQGLPKEYDLIRYNASANGDEYDLEKISNTARNMWYSNTGLTC